MKIVSSFIVIMCFVFFWNAILHVISIINIIIDSFFNSLFFRYVEIAKLLIENGSKIDFREPTDELYPRTMMSDEPLRLALKNRHYVSPATSFSQSSITI